MKTKTHCTPGFTLVEILIVVAIIGVLIAVAIPNFAKSRKNAQKNTCIANMKKIEGAVEQWAVEENKARDAVVTMADLVPNYLKSVMTCPAGSAPYGLTTPADPPFCPNEATETDHVIGMP